MVRTAGSKSFTACETQLLLDMVEQYRPLGKQRWDEVACSYNDQANAKDWCERDAEALKRRFMVLAYAKKPSDEWREFMVRAGMLHQSILEESGASAPNIHLSIDEVNAMGDMALGGTGGVSSSGHSSLRGDDANEGMLLLSGADVDLVHSSGVSSMQPNYADDEFINRLSAEGMDASVVAAAAAAAAASGRNVNVGGNTSNNGSTSNASGTMSNSAGGMGSGSAQNGQGSLMMALSSGCQSLIVNTPMRTGKRGRPPGSTTGSAAKRVAQQAEQVILLSRTVLELQKQLRDANELLAGVLETQANHSAVIDVLRQTVATAGSAVGSASSKSSSSNNSAAAAAAASRLGKAAGMVMADDSDSSSATGNKSNKQSDYHQHLLI